MNLISCVKREDWGIGKNGELLFHIPEDLKIFKQKTINNTVIMGRKTFESLPGNTLEDKLLKDRRNIIITKDKNFNVDGAIICNNINNIFRLMKFKIIDYDKTWIIGGESIYKLFLPYCKFAEITKVEDPNAQNIKPDVFFPNLDVNPDWKIHISYNEPRYYKGLCYKYYVYVNKNSILPY